MTLEFKCPYCKQTCAFKNQYAGRRARCTHCQNLFIIPSKSGDIPKKFIARQEDGNPLPGFYEAFLKKTPSAIFNRNSLQGFIFIIAAVAIRYLAEQYNFKFSFFIPATGKIMSIYLPFGKIISAATWVCLFWYYMEIIYAVAFDVEALPETYMGSQVDLHMTFFSSIFTFTTVLVLSELPLVLCFVLFKIIGFAQYVWLWIPAACGLFLFPIFLINVSIVRDITVLFDFKNIIKPLRKAFKPYCIVGLLFVLTVFFQTLIPTHLKTLNGFSLMAGLFLLLNIVIQLLAVLTMRAAGLFVRHYGCYLPWS